MKQVILSIDQGTTSTRAILFDTFGQLLYTAQQEISQIYPHDGWVEQLPDEIWSSTLSVIHDVVAYAENHQFKICGAGITNQRETTIVWDKKTGQPVYNAIVWQDRRTAEYCRQLQNDGYGDSVRTKTGLLLDPYFSATKLNWIFQNDTSLRARMEAGQLLFGTIDCFLLWKLTEGQSHYTDVTNASRTMLFNIHSLEWDDELLNLFGIPQSCLPEVKDCIDLFGQISHDIIPGSIPVVAMAGDQQSAAFGQACFTKGMTKSTYGTGCFVMTHTGEKPLFSNHQLITTIAYKTKDHIAYALEGSVFIAGALIQWLRDELKIIHHASDTERIAEQTQGNKGVFVVPAFAGLGAPHWDPDARGAMFGLTRDTGIPELIRASLESIAYQTYDLYRAIIQDGVYPEITRIDGGMSNNDWFCQFLSDILQTPTVRPKITETTALGVAYMTALGLDIYQSLDQISALWQEDALFQPTMTTTTHDNLIGQWDKYVNLVKSN